MLGMCGGAKRNRGQPGDNQRTGASCLNSEPQFPQDQGEFGGCGNGWLRIFPVLKL